MTNTTKNMTAKQTATLTALVELGNATTEEVADALKISPSAARARLRRLEALELVDCDRTEGSYCNGSSALVTLEWSADGDDDEVRAALGLAPLVDDEDEDEDETSAPAAPEAVAPEAPESPAKATDADHGWSDADLASEPHARPKAPLGTPRREAQLAQLKREREGRVASVEVEQLEGRMPLAHVKVDSYAAATLILKGIAFDFDGPGYRKVRVTVRWRNGEELFMRCDVHACGTGCDVAASAAGLVDYMLSDACGLSLSPEAVARARRIKASCALTG